MAEIPTDMAEMFRSDHRYWHRHRVRRQKSSHLKHGRRVPSPVREWKKEHYGHARPDPQTRENREGSNEDNPKSPSLSDSESESSSPSYTSAQDHPQSPSPSPSPSRTEAYPDPETMHTSTQDPQPQTNTQNHPDLPPISKPPTTHDPEPEPPEENSNLQTLSLEATLRQHRSRDKSVETREFLTDARYHVARAGKHILDWILLLPTDLSLSFSKGFHNAPKLYHDSMVQETPTVRGVRGGVRAAGTVRYPPLAWLIG